MAETRNLHRRAFVGLGLGVACACVATAGALAEPAPKESPTGKWVCPPCGCDADGKTFDGPGQCPACDIQLVPKPVEPDKPKF